MRPEDITVAFVEPLYEINVGYVARCMKNFGLSKLVLVKPRCIIGSEAFRFAAHAQDVLSKAHVVSNLENLKENYDLIAGTTGVVARELSNVRRWITPAEFAKRVIQQTGNVLIVLGREDIGLTNSELSLCDIVVFIPTNPGYPILNVSHASAIIFYEIYKQAGLTLSLQRLPKREEVELLLHYWRNLILTLGGSKERAERACLMIRRLIGGSPFTDSDVRML
ncbi:MAG: TrmJ/YjtD family RNA methyltransferase, partial [Thermofilaceae archaeon]